MLKEIKNHSAPGPDKVLPVRLKNTGSVIIRSLTELFNLSWNNRSVRRCWKQENKIYIKKLGKPDYHIEKAYSGLSLTSVTGKLMERVVKKRFYVWLEENNIRDMMQSAYRHDENIAVYA